MSAAIPGTFEWVVPRLPYIADEILGIKQPHVLAVMHNRAGNFSVGRLMAFLTALGQDVEITVKPARKAKGRDGVANQEMPGNVSNLRRAVLERCVNVVREAP